MEITVDARSDEMFSLRMELRKDPITRSWVITGDDVPDASPRTDSPCRFCADATTPLQVIASRTEVEGVPWSALDVRSYAPDMRTPLLVVHDRDDAEVPWQDGAIVARGWPGAVLSTTGGLGHRRILRDPRVVSAATAFLAEHVRPRGRERVFGEVTASVA